MSCVMLTTEVDLELRPVIAIWELALVLLGLAFLHDLVLVYQVLVIALNGIIGCLVTLPMIFTHVISFDRKKFPTS